MTRRTAILAGAALADATLAGCLGRSVPAGGPVIDLVRTSFAAPRVREVRVENQVGDVRSPRSVPAMSTSRG